MSTKVQVFDKNGSAKGTFELNPLWLESVKGEQAIHESVVAYLAGLRAGTAKTKTRGEVSGGGKNHINKKVQVVPVPVQPEARFGAVVVPVLVQYPVHTTNMSIKKLKDWQLEELLLIDLTPAK